MGCLSDPDGAVHAPVRRVIRVFSLHRFWQHCGSGSETNTMPANEWDAPCRFGRSEIEHQHELLVDLADTLALLRGDKAKLEATALQLYRQIRMHFDFEEEVMRAAEYPEMPEHVTAHRRLIGLLNDLWEPKLLHDFVCSTLVQHIHDHDDRLSAFLADKPVLSANPRTRRT